MSGCPRQWPERPGMKDALERLRNGRRVKPNESDAPPLSTFPGPKHKPLEGQLRLDRALLSASHCPSCGRRCGNKTCSESPRGADAWRRVLRAREAALQEKA